MALLQRFAGFKNGYFQFRTQGRELVGGKNAAGPCTDNNYIIMIHRDPSFRKLPAYHSKNAEKMQA